MKSGDRCWPGRLRELVEDSRISSVISRQSPASRQRQSSVVSRQSSVSRLSSAVYRLGSAGRCAGKCDLWTYVDVTVLNESPSLSRSHCVEENEAR